MIEKILRQRRLVRKAMRIATVAWKPALMAALALGVVVAWGFMVDMSEKINRTLAGEDRIEIIEEFDPPDELAPGEYVAKRAWAKNVGDVDCFVRAMCLFSDESMAQFASIDLGLVGWSEPDENGWRYFERPLSPGESTDLICSGVSILTSATASDLKPFDIYVMAESVQSYGHSDALSAFESIAGAHAPSDDEKVENDDESVSGDLKGGDGDDASD